MHFNDIISQYRRVKDYNLLFSKTRTLEEFNLLHDENIFEKFKRKKIQFFNIFFPYQNLLDINVYCLYRMIISGVWWYRTYLSTLQSDSEDINYMSKDRRSYVIIKNMFPKRNIFMTDLLQSSQYQ